jgi:hypothetical protein
MGIETTGVNIKLSETFYHVGNTQDKNRQKFTFTPKGLNPVHTRKFLQTFCLGPSHSNKMFAKIDIHRHEFKPLHIEHAK